MKKFLSLRLAFFAMVFALDLLSGPQTAKAVVIATEDFSDANGALFVMMQGEPMGKHFHLGT